MGRCDAVVEFDHIGMLTSDFEAVLELAERLGIEPGPVETKPEKGLEIQWLDAGGVQLEFIRPLAPDGRAAEALRDHGAGLHHIGLEVADIDLTLGELAAAGVPLVDQEPRPGSRGTRIAFLAPDAAGGSRIELVEHPEPLP